MHPVTRVVLAAAAAIALCLPAGAQQPAGGTAGPTRVDDPRATQVLEAVRERYAGLSTFYARCRRIDHYYSEWSIREELRVWAEQRKRPNMLWIESGFIQEHPEFGLTGEQRLMGEEPPAGTPIKDAPLSQSRVKADGKAMWHEYFGLYAIEGLCGNGQFDTENMASQDSRKLATLAPGMPWPSDPDPTLPITVAELLDHRDLGARIIPGSVKLTTGKDEDGQPKLTEPIYCLTKDGEQGEVRECSHIVFLLTNGTEQHWWVDAETSMIRAERVFRPVAPAKSPFEDLSPKVEIPTDLTPLQKDRIQRVRRYMTGQWFRSDLTYDFLAWDFDSPDSDYVYVPDSAVTVVKPNELAQRLDRLYEMCTGDPVRRPPPPAADDAAQQ